MMKKVYVIRYRVFGDFISRGNPPCLKHIIAKNQQKAIERFYKLMKTPSITIQSIKEEPDSYVKAINDFANELSKLYSDFPPAENGKPYVVNTEVILQNIQDIKEILLEKRQN